MWSSLGIRQKVFVLFSILALSPLLVISVIWVRSSRSQLKSAAVTRQNIYIDSASQRVNNQLQAKLNSVISHSQESSVINIDVAQAKLNLLQYANQENDITRISLVDHAGNEQVVVENHALTPTLTNIKASDSFKVVTQLSNEVSVSDVKMVNNVPQITVAVPLLGFSKLGSQDLTTAESLARRSGSDVKGALIVDINVTDFWESILTNKIGGTSYTYIVDSTGKLLDHPDPKVLKSNTDLSKTDQVAQLLAKPDANISPAITTSETGVKVLSSSFPIKSTGWSVVLEEPYAVITKPADNVLKLALTIFGIAALASIMFSLFFSSTLTRPISKLVAGTAEASKGNLDTQIQINSTDEIGVLAHRFNDMATNLSRLITNIRNESNKLNIVLENVNESIIATDSSNSIVFANISAAVIAGVLPTDLTGKKFEEVYKLVSGKQPFHIDPESTTVSKDIVYISPNDRVHYLDISVNKILNDSEGIQRIITLRDQTDERELEAMKLDFVSMAAHELRTPLTAVRGYLALLATDQESQLSADSQLSVGRAQASTKLLVGLINNLLNVSKIERGSLNLIFTKIDWVQTVLTAIEDNKFSANEKGISIDYAGPHEELPLVADEFAIREVFNNLIANAIHYTNKDGHIIVGVHIDGTQVVTYVNDDGIGMTPNVVERLFTKFYRAKGPLSSGSGGTGLGLYISKSIVELHKGKIWVDSVFSKGSTFTFTLPAFDELQYEQMDKQKVGVNKRRGWITKNTTS